VLVVSTAVTNLVSAVEVFMVASNGDGPELRKKVVDASVFFLKQDTDPRAHELEQLLRDVLDGGRRDDRVTTDIAYVASQIGKSTGAEIPGQPEEEAPETRRLPSPQEPMRVARCLLPALTVDGQSTLRRWRGGWMRWRTTHWAEAPDAEIRAWLYHEVEHAEYLDTSKRMPEVRPWAPTRHKIDDLADATSAVTHLADSVNPPAWLASSGHRLAGSLIACTNGILELETRRLLKHNPRHFTLVSVPFAYDPEAPRPQRWLRFLKELWADDPDQVAALQEWFGYVISGRTDLQKILLLVGPTRAGKGVIGKVLTALVGAANMTGPTLSSLATNFGLQDLVNKPLAIISDARLGRGDVHVVVERLLSISGEDTLTVDRKYLGPVDGEVAHEVHGADKRVTPSW
jgi:putative DNA primase/helicase